jgi:hypothetical protein
MFGAGAIMNRLLPAIAALLMLIAGIAVATAAPPVPSSVMPGRERDRFTDSPVERFMQPGPYQSPQVFAPATEPPCGVHKARPGKSRSAKRRNC